MTIYNYSGWHTLFTMQAERLYQDGACSAIKYNAIMLSSYIPAIGAVIGSCHTYGAFVNPKLTLSTRIYFAARGLIEIIGIGILFLIPDFLVTCHRTFKYAAYPAPTSY